jgi:hypothetical protein
MRKLAVCVKLDEITQRGIEVGATKDKAGRAVLNRPFFDNRRKCLGTRTILWGGTPK